MKEGGLKLPRSVIEVYLDKDHDILFIRFKEPERVKLGESLKQKRLQHSLQRRKTTRLQHLK